MLVVDDDAEVRDLYGALLLFYGFCVEAAADGRTGLALAAEHLPDAVVLDFSMPEMDGGEVLGRLKADARTRLIPVVMLTAVPELVGPNARGACAAFLAKPCEPEVLVRTLTSVMAPIATPIAPSEEPPRESTGE